MSSYYRYFPRPDKTSYYLNIFCILCYDVIELMEKINSEQDKQKCIFICAFFKMPIDQDETQLCF
jgi:hypothetical protein